MVHSAKNTLDLSATLTAAGISWLPLLVGGGLAGAAWNIYKNSSFKKNRDK